MKGIIPIGFRAKRPKDDFPLYGVITDDGKDVEFYAATILTDSRKRAMAWIFRQVEEEMDIDGDGDGDGDGKGSKE